MKFIKLIAIAATIGMFSSSFAFESIAVTKEELKIEAEALFDAEAQFTNFAYAVANNNHELVAKYIAAGADITNKVTEGNTYLHIAANMGSTACARLLIDAGADINAKANLGITPLHSALEDPSDPDIADMLIASGADVNARDINGDTPLHKTILFIAEYKWALPLIAKILIDAGANVNAQNNNNQTPLDYSEHKNIEDFPGYLAYFGDLMNAIEYSPRLAVALIIFHRGGSQGHLLENK